MPKVLIIDDEPFTVEMLQTFLQIHGYEAVGALNGTDGVILSQVESPDVLLLDLMLPDIDGFEVCRRLRTVPATTRLPVLILSARTAQVDIDRALALGANGYLTKPVRFPELLSELKRLLAPPAPVELPLPINGATVPNQLTLPLRTVERPQNKPPDAGASLPSTPKTT